MADATEQVTVSDAAIALLVLDQLREQSRERQLVLLKKIRQLKRDLRDAEDQFLKEVEFLNKQNMLTQNTLDVAKEATQFYKNPR